MRTIALLFLALPLWSQNIFNCSSGFSPTTGACAVDLTGYNPNHYPFSLPGAAGAYGSFSGSTLILLPYPGGHLAQTMMYQAATVNVQAFTASFTFIPDGKNVAFAVVHTNNQANGFPFDSSNFSAGAGCEAGFYQAFPGSYPEPNNVWALELDSGSGLTNVSPYTFTYSGVQIYEGNNTGTTYGAQSPCIPPYNPDPPSTPDPTPNKISTSPVPLNSPANSQGTTTGDTYSATITYDGSNVTLKLYDITAGGSCPGATCFTNTWSGVNIPSIVGGNNAAYVGLTGGSNSDNVGPLYISTFSYTVNSPASTTQAGVSGSGKISGAPIQ